MVPQSLVGLADFSGVNPRAVLDTRERSSDEPAWPRPRASPIQAAICEFWLWNEAQLFCDGQLTLDQHVSTSALELSCCRARISVIFSPLV
jgi:hypothetical protein